MRLPRFRLRTLMILVAVVAVGLFAERTRKTWKAFRKQADAYESLERYWIRIGNECDGRLRELRASAEELKRSDGPEEFDQEDIDGMFGLLNAWADEIRADALKYGRLKRNYRSRWW